MKSKYLYILFLFASFHTYAQSKAIKGRITNSGETSNIHVLNTTSRYNTITDQDGNFEIQVKSKDTLVFSAIHFFPKKVVITEEMYKNQFLEVTLEILLNELDEVFIGNSLTGNLEKDVLSIKTQKNLNFDDVGIPGYKGEMREEIPNLIGQTLTPVSVDLESLYKYISGYYKKLRMQRMWVSQDLTASKILNLYSSSFFLDTFQIPKNQTFDFLLFCIENSDIKRDFDIKNYNGVLAVFKVKAPIYLARFEVEE